MPSPGEWARRAIRSRDDGGAGDAPVRVERDPAIPGEQEKLPPARVRALAS